MIGQGHFHGTEDVHGVHAFLPVGTEFGHVRGHCAPGRATVGQQQGIGQGQEQGYHQGGEPWPGGNRQALQTTLLMDLQQQGGDRDRHRDPERHLDEIGHGFVTEGLGAAVQLRCVQVALARLEDEGPGDQHGEQGDGAQVLGHRGAGDLGQARGPGKQGKPQQPEHDEGVPAGLEQLEADAAHGVGQEDQREQQAVQHARQPALGFHEGQVLAAQQHFAQGGGVVDSGLAKILLTARGDARGSRCSTGEIGGDAAADEEPEYLEQSHAQGVEADGHQQQSTAGLQQAQGVLPHADLVLHRQQQV